MRDLPVFFAVLLTGLGAGISFAAGVLCLGVQLYRLVITGHWPDFNLGQWLAAIDHVPSALIALASALPLAFVFFLAGFLSLAAFNRLA